MMHLNFCRSLLALACLLSACAPQNLPTLPVGPAQAQQAMAQVYVFQTQGFSLAAATLMPAQHTAWIEEARQELAADLSTQALAAYRRPADFQILLLPGLDSPLLSGSEGNHFRSTGALPQAKSPAQALIFDAQGRLQRFKGEYEQEQLFFSGHSAFSHPNTTYLILPDAQGQIQVYTGQLESPEAASDAPVEAPVETPLSTRDRNSQLLSPLLHGPSVYAMPATAYAVPATATRTLTGVRAVPGPMPYLSTEGRPYPNSTGGAPTAVYSGSVQGPGLRAIYSAAPQLGPVWETGFVSTLPASSPEPQPPDAE